MLADPAEHAEARYLPRSPSASISWDETVYFNAMRDEENPTRTSDDAWLESLASAAVPATATAAEPVAAPGPLDRDRPPRRPIVARRVVVSLAAVLVAAIALLVAIPLALNARSVDAPDVVGLDVSVATTRLSRDGLTVQVASERFSDRPKGTVLEQDPPAGEPMDRTEPLLVIVSAGTEEFALPDVIGDGITLARGTLEGLGLVVQLEAVVSDAPSDTVLATTPAPESPVRTGDVVRVQVATPRVDGGELRPYRLEGVTVRLDPAPVGQGPDITLEVARRLRALLEASGATVTMLRSATDESTTDAARAVRAAESSATLSIGLSLRGGPQAGRLVSSPPSSTAVIGTASGTFAAEAASRLGSSVPPVERATSTADPVLSAVTEPWVRVVLGSTDARADANSFADPVWSDLVARALYAAVGEVYGQQVSP